MIKKQFMTLLTLVLLSLTLLSCGSNSNKKSFNNDSDKSTEEYDRKIKDMKNLDINIEYRPQQNTELNIFVKITNNTDHDIVIFPEIHLPLLFTVIEDGNIINPISININIDETEIVMKAGTSRYSNYDISYYYYIHKGTHRYEITREPLEGWKSNTIEFDATLTKNGGRHENTK